jgi:predicted nucleotidyltransferase
MQPFISAHREEIAELCRKYHVRRLSVFGSAVRDDFDASRSDVDIIVEFAEFPLAEYLDNKWALHDELAAKLKHRVDLLTWQSLSNPVIRKEVESTHVTLYAA